MSYYNISKKILSLSKIQVNSETEKDIYLYGIETLVSLVVNCTILFILALSFHLEKEFLCYLLFFIPLRTYGGGIHAKNHIQCILLFTLLLFFSIMAAVPVSSRPFYALYIIPILIFKLICASIQKKSSKSRNSKIAFFLSIAAAFIILSLLLFNNIFSAGIEYYITLSSFGILVQTLTSLPILFQTS